MPQDEVVDRFSSSAELSEQTSVAAPVGQETVRVRVEASKFDLICGTISCFVIAAGFLFGIFEMIKFWVIHMNSYSTASSSDIDDDYDNEHSRYNYDK